MSFPVPSRFDAVTNAGRWSALAPRLLIAALGCAVFAPAHAVINVFANDRPGFLAASGAVTIGALPASGGDGTVVGPVTFNGAGPGAVVAMGDWSNEIAGFDLAISGPENFNLLIAGGTYAIGFDWHEPMTSGAPPGCGVPTCADSNFTIELLAGGVSLGVFSYNPPDDLSNASGGPLGFWGVHSSVLFDELRVREVVANADNEYFGNFLVGNVAAVPEPATAASLLAGLGLLAVALRRGAGAAGR